MLHRFSKFTKNSSHLMHLFKTQVRGCLEYRSTVWHSGLSDSDCKDIERVQSAAMRMIMGKRYQGYEDEEALKNMNLDELDSLRLRREKIALKFAKKSLKQVSFSGLFPVSNPKHGMKKRSPDKYIVNHSNTER